MNQATPPIFVIDGQDVIVFESVKEAKLSLEPIDVTNSVYVAYDAQGRLLRLETDDRRVNMFLAQDEPTHADELEAALREFLQAMNEPIANDTTCGLPSLVEACRKFTHNPTLEEMFLRVWHNVIRKFRKQLTL